MTTKERLQAYMIRLCEQLDKVKELEASNKRLRELVESLLAANRSN